MRKLRTIHDTPNENVRQKMLCLADKVANLRNMNFDYKMIGDELWERFHAPKELQAWYYSKLNDGLEELQNYPETEAVYWEMTALYKDLFVKYFVDDDKGLLYMISDDGDDAILKKGKPQWNPLDSSVSKTARPISRKDAERIEDNWAEPFWEMHEQDLSDASYDIFHSERRSLSIRISNGELTFSGEDWGKECESINGKDEYEFYYSLDADSTHRLLVQLRMKHGRRLKLSTIFKKEFGSDDGSVKFKAYCDEIGVDARFFSI